MKLIYALFMVLAFGGAALFSQPLYAVHAAAPTMCGVRAPYRTLNVSVELGGGITQTDVDTAFADWNNLWIKYHGFPLFQPTPWGAAPDVVVTPDTQYTWTQTPCISPSLGLMGKVHLGWADSWRNAQWLPHELGHTLGLPDFLQPGTDTNKYIGPQPCGNYIGVMSACTSPQAWFLDLSVPGYTFDGDLVRDFYQ